MPHTITMRRKTIIIKKGTSLLLQLFETHLTSISSEQKSVLRISFDEKTQEGLPGSIKSKLEFVTGQKHGAKECFFGDIECSLSDSANNIRKEYLTFLNNLLAKAGIFSKKTEGDVIESRYVLLYEILLRLLTVALSNEENAKREGYQFISAMESFVNTCMTHETLNLNQLFCCELNEQHSDWIVQFRQAVAVIQLIYLPENAFTALINYLGNIQKTLQAHLLAHFNAIEVSQDLSDQRIHTTYKNFMNLNTHSSLTLNLLEELHPSQLAKSRKIKNKKSLEVVSNLFRILNQTTFLLNTVVKIENMIKVSGWILLLTGKLRFDELIDYIKLHQKRCEQVLNVNNTGIDKNGKLCEMLLRQGRLNGKAITHVVPSICQKLRQLGNIDEHEILIKQFATDVQSLVEDEKILGIRLIEKEKSLSLHKGQIQDKQKNLKSGQKSTLFLPTLTTSLEDPIVTVLHHSSSPLDIIPNYTPEEKLEEPPLLSTPTLQTPPPSPPQSNITEYKETTMETKNKKEKEFENDQNIALQQLFTQEPSLQSEEKTNLLPTASNENKPLSTEASDNKSEVDIEKILSNEVTPDPELEKDNFQDEIPKYIKDFFASFADVNYEKNILYLKQRSLRDAQTKKHGQALSDLNEEKAIPDLHQGEFLELFACNEYFKKAAPFCRKIRKVILDFEQSHMETTEPSGINKVFDRHLVWKKRHYELLALKYLCLIAVSSDERALKDFVKNFIDENEWKAPFAYQNLREQLNKVLQEKPPIRQFLYVGLTTLQTPKILKLEDEKSSLKLKIKNLLITQEDFKKELEAQKIRSDLLEKRFELWEKQQNNNNTGTNPNNGVQERQCLIM